MLAAGTGPTACAAAPAADAGVSAGASAFQPSATSRHPVEALHGGRSAIAPDMGSSRASPTCSADDVRARLGDRAFTVIRQAMLAQQEAWIDQLWELHRLAQTQARRVALLGTDLADLTAAHGASSVVFDRQRQATSRAQIMRSIRTLPTIPATLRAASASTEAEASAPAATPAGFAPPLNGGTASLQRCSPDGSNAGGSGSGSGNSGGGLLGTLPHVPDASPANTFPGCGAFPSSGAVAVVPFDTRRLYCSRLRAPALLLSLCGRP